MGLPEVIIEFKQKAVSAMKRSERGVVVLILKESALSTIKEFRSIEQVPSDVYTVDNLDYINKVFMGTPAKVIVVPVATTNGQVAEALKLIKNMKFNYLAMPDAATQDVTTIETWVKGCRQTDKKTFKAVLSGATGEHEAIINFATEGIQVDEKTYSAQKYTARIAGILAGLPLSRSATYYVLPEVKKVIESLDPNKDINDGKLILINDGEKIKIGRGVNSLKTFTGDKTKDWSKIKIVEGMDLITEDIRTTFNDNYVGLVINNYENKMLFVASVNAYFRTLEKEYVLDNSVENIADVDVAAHEQYLNEKGQDTTDMTDLQLRKANTGSDVFLTAKAKLVDAVEDLTFLVHI